MAACDDLPDPADWGLSGPLVPLAGGNRSAVLRCGGAVFKRTAHGEAGLRWLDPVQAAARAAGFLVPDPIPLPCGARQKHGWTAERHVPSMPCSDVARHRPSVLRFHRMTDGLPQRPDRLDIVALSERGRDGEIDLRVIPQPLRHVLVDALAAAQDQPTGPIHGDLNRENLRIAPDGRPVLIDWDEARSDARFHDLAALGDAVPEAQARAALAREIASCWRPEPHRARALAEELLRCAGCGPIP